MCCDKTCTESGINRKLAAIFKESGVVEKYGSGIKRIQNRFRQYGLDIPVFENFQHGFKVPANKLRETFDYIITDAPPVGIVTDAQILEKQADVTLFVLRHEFTPKERLKTLDTLYREKKFKNKNLIFNAVQAGGKYGYGYGYGYGYYQESEMKGSGNTKIAKK